ncbi:MAG: DUF2071 domain-containing protein [Opitutales bacterium]|jgi:uncharacterized protein|nr:DUF2071 domain-containing protein [Opitutales bacterium]MDP4645274.1 DUF2071 domain-containing protein [Opitutales bacterium]MDP4879233.1 DUF2071 domain-containing protein [Opitutales bacterium]
MMTELSPTTTLDARIAEQAVPAQPVVMYQRWEELLFLHWAVAPEVVAEILPPGLRVDTFDGEAWIGVVPFSMRAIRPRFLPAVKGLSDFPELNLRTYVVDEKGRPGVWFYSLDTPKRLPNWIARTFFNLNYRLSRIHVHKQGACIDYCSELWMGADWDAPQKYEWERIGTTTHAEPGSLEFFLVERYRLFAYDRKAERLFTGKVHHEPYRLQTAKLSHYTKRLFELNGLVAPDGSPASVIASQGVNVRIYPMERVT